ncbi:hypothetical protein [Xanthomonas bromi]|nr:hypothetical protein [Xanthomonas bromi]
MERVFVASIEGKSITDRRETHQPKFIIYLWQTWRLSAFENLASIGVDST